MGKLIKYLCCIVVAFVFVLSARGQQSPVVNIKYIHTAIKHRWGLDIPYSPALVNPNVAANMRYLLGMIDIANKRLGTTTNYGAGEYATSHAASWNTVNTAVQKLVSPKMTFPFTATTTNDTTEFSFSIGARGTYWIDWGDNTEIERIYNGNTTAMTIAHIYVNAGAYNIKIGGVSAEYSAATSAISFYYNENLAGISGSLGAIFPNIGTNMPSFNNTFSMCHNMAGNIPAELFAGVNGAPVGKMFYHLFYNNSKLTGNIPVGLFSGLSGPYKGEMFAGTFFNCYKLTGPIPAGLFGDLWGVPQYRMFNTTFARAGVTSIPTGLFGNVYGAPAWGMFDGTFSGCSKLTGPSATNPDGTPLYQVFPDATTDNVENMYLGATELDDYDDIPDAWK